MPRPKLYPTGHKNVKCSTLHEDDPEAAFYSDLRIEGKRIMRRLGTDYEEAKGIVDGWITNAELTGPFRLSKLCEMHTRINSGRVKESTVIGWASSDRVLSRELNDPMSHQLSTIQIETWFARRKETSSSATANRHFTRLRQVLRWAVKRGYLTRDPTEPLKLYREPEGRCRYLSDEEEDLLRRACHPVWFDWFKFAMLTGLRQGEQLSLQWASVGPESISVTSDKAKSHRSRRIPLTPSGKAILNRRRGIDDTWVFCAPKGGQWNRRSFYFTWRPIVEKAKIKDFTWHDLRHTFCSRLVQRGAPLYRVCKLAGHRSIMITERYAHLAPGNLEETIMLLED